MQAEVIESRFIFNTAVNNINYVTDNEGKQLGFLKNSNGNNIIFTKDLEGSDVAIEHFPDGTKVFHMEKDSKGLPAMHEFKPDGTEIIYLFDANKHLEKVVELKINGDKLTTWFSPEGESISQEQRQNSGILFNMNSNGRTAVIWLQPDGTVETHGNEKLIKHLAVVFNKYLDGCEIG